MENGNPRQINPGMSLGLAGDSSLLEGRVASSDPGQHYKAELSQLSSYPLGIGPCLKWPGAASAAAPHAGFAEPPARGPGHSGPRGSCPTWLGAPRTVPGRSPRAGLALPPPVPASLASRFVLLEIPSCSLFCLFCLRFPFLFTGPLPAGKGRTAESAVQNEACSASWVHDSNSRHSPRHSKRGALKVSTQTEKEELVDMQVHVHLYIKRLNI